MLALVYVPPLLPPVPWSTCCCCQYPRDRELRAVAIGLWSACCCYSPVLWHFGYLGTNRV